MFRRSFQPIARAVAVTAGRHRARAFSSQASSSSSNAFGLKSFVLFAGVVTGTALLLANESHAEPSATEVAAIQKDLIALLDAEDSRRGDGTSMAPTLVRLAWHAAGTFSVHDGTGGSNGATMRFPPEASWGANNGLKAARDFLEPLKAKYPSISYADLWTLSGATAIEAMGGPKIAWRSGRTDSEGPTTVADGRLPSADKGQSSNTISHIRDVFYRLGFNDREMVALIGAHAVGRCHTNASGYWGPWTRAESTFSNEYFRLLIEEKWTVKTTHEGKPWKGPKQYESKDGTLMMLPADLALIEDPEFRKVVEIYAKDEAVFFKDFSDAFGKLLERGVKFPKKGLFGLW